VLGEILRRFSPPVSDRLLVGIDGIDDAGVYRLSPDAALVQTVDFFPPIVDDPYAFGQVAAANAISDVYAMGGRPITALNILGFPANMDPEIVGEILCGGADKIAEAETVIVGGHSVKDNELKYGLAVTGIIDPDRIMTNGGAKAGDRLILTKPLGTGIISTAVKRNRASAAEETALIKVMTALNREASEAMMQYGAHAATDVTGFGLAGHAYEMATASDMSVEINFKDIRLLPGTIAHAEAGTLTGGAVANEQYLEGKIEFDPALEKSARDIAFDAQTSGGLLIAIAETTAGKLVGSLSDLGVNAFDIGRIIPKDDIVISVK